MSLFINSRVRVEKRVVLHVKRKLAGGRGEFFIKEGQEVTPTLSLGEGNTVTGFKTIPLAEKLGVHPKEALKYLKRSLGKNIYQGELLAKRENVLGLKPLIITSPFDGLIDFYDNNRGDLRIRALPHKVNLLSGVYGIVDRVEPTLGFALIRTLATIVHGVNGSGMEREGILKVLGAKESFISSRQINENLEEHILVGGGLLLEDAIVKAVSVRAKGIVTGGINARDFAKVCDAGLSINKKRWSDAGISIVLTEGFGSIPIGEDIFECLKSFDEGFAILDGNKMKLILPTSLEEDMIYIRKVSVPIKKVVDAEPDIMIVPLRVGQKVRIVTNPFFGTQGEVLAIDETPTKMPSGFMTYFVTIETRLSKIRIPYNNIEGLEV